MAHHLAIVEEPQRAGFHGEPILIVGERLCGDYRHAVIGRGHFTEIHHHVFVLQVCRLERRTPHDITQFGRTMRKQAVAVAK